MGKRDERIDAYIAKARDFARPILEHLRESVHANCPEVEETMKWSSPFFMYRGAILCNMATFKEHCAFGFWRNGREVLGEENAAGQAMGNLGRITSLEDLPPDDVLGAHIRRAMDLAEAGPARGARASVKPEAEVPEDLRSALAASPQASAAFHAFTPSQRREYVEWITEAKTQATRERRLATTLEWVAEGKSRNWKYQKR